MQLSDDEDIEALRDLVRRFVEKEVPPELAAQWDREDRIPREWLGRIADLGVCGLAIPEEFGGFGLNVIGLLTTIMELGRGGIMLASLFIQNACYGGMNISQSGSAGQKQQLLPRLARGELIFAYGLSEPDIGADLASVNTRAERIGERIVVNGAKRWCTGAAIADYIYMLVRTGEPDARYRNLTFLLVPPGTPGISLQETPTLGLRGIPTNDVILENVALPLEAVVGGEAGWNRGWERLTGHSLEVEKLVSSSLALVTAQSAVEEAWAYSQQRKQFGKAICAQQSIRHMLADAQTKLQACRLMLMNAARKVDIGEPSAVDTSMAKLFVSDTAREIVLTCQQVLGAYGYAHGFAMERYVRDVLVMPIWGGSSAIQKNNIANLLRLPKE